MYLNDVQMILDLNYTVAILLFPVFIAFESLCVEDDKVLFARGRLMPSGEMEGAGDNKQTHIHEQME